MPRIRTIKPEFWSSPDVARASAVARLAYIAMWNWADDYGIGTFNLKELEGFIFPNDDVEELSGGKSRKFRDVAEEVVSCFGLVIFEAERRLFYAIPGWEKHQRTERKAKGKFPTPDQGKIVTDQWVSKSVATSEEVLGISYASQGSSGTGTGEQGNRGTGNSISIAHPPEAREKNTYPRRFEEWYAMWPRKKSKGDALKAFNAALKRVEFDELMSKTQRIVKAWESQGKDLQYIPYPASWLRADGWEDDITEPTRRNSNSFLEFSQALRSVDGDQRAIG